MYMIGEYHVYLLLVCLINVLNIVGYVKSYINYYKLRDVKSRGRLERTATCDYRTRVLTGRSQ